MLTGHVGRNDACPCGSGKRYKDCHGSLDSPATWHLVGARDLERGDFSSAAANIGKAIAKDPLRAEFHRDLARAQFGEGLENESAASARRAIELDSADAGAWNVLGLSLENTEPDVALAAWERAAAFAPRDPEAPFRIGDFFRRRRDFDAAITAYRAALAIAPNHAVLRNNIALALQEQGQLDEAEHYYRGAIEQQPSLVEALANLGDLCQVTDRAAEAIVWFKQALAKDPNVAELWTKLGNCQHRQGEMRDARTSFERANSLAPDDPKSILNLASILIADSRYAEASPLVQKALTLEPDLAQAQDMLLYVNQQTCQWRDLDRLFEQQRARLRDRAAPAVVPHNLSALPYTAGELLVANRKWVAQHIRPKPATPPDPSQLPDDKLRIAYLGSDFRTHPFANLMTEVIELHDRSRFEVFGYSFGPDDRSPARARFARAFDHFVDVRAESFDQTARRIRGDRIAILFDTGGYILYARSEIFALRPAPIQINFTFNTTLGADYYDYILTDRFATPAREQVNFAERFMLLPHCYVPADTRRPIAPVPTRAECRLPERGVVFCCFNASYKILPDVFAIWMRLLERVPDSVLWLLDTNPSVSENLRREAQSRNVSPERLIFAPRIPLAEHLARHGVADLFLDTLPYNAHTTANDALFAGLPLITCAGETFASRVSGSHLHAIGLPELVTDSLDDYAALALKLALDPGLLGRYRARLRANRDTFPLFDTPGYTHALDGLLMDAWEERLRTSSVAHLQR